MITKVISSETITTDPSTVETVRSEAVQARPHSSVPVAGGLVVPPVPTTVEGRSAWFKQIASDEALAIAQLTALGAYVERVEEPFTSLLTDEDGAGKLVRGRTSAEVVYHDRSLAGTGFEFMPLPQVLACLVNRRPLRLPKGAAD